MKISHILFITLMTGGITGVAQVQIDKTIQLTGSGSDAKITGIKDVNTAEDAVSAEVLQNNTLVYSGAVLNGSVYEITLTPAVTSLQSGQVFHFRADVTNSGSASLKVNETAAKDIKKNFDQPVIMGDIRGGQMVSVIYDGVNDCFQMMSQLGNASGGSSSSTMDYTFAGNVSSITVAAGFDTDNITLTSTFVSGAPSATSITLSGVPSGVTYNLSPGGGYPSFTSTLIFHVPGTTPNGTYPITVTSTGGAADKTVSFNLVIVTGYRIFVTSTFYTGSAIGSLSNADNICQTRANAGGLSGTFQALMGDGTTTAASRVTISDAVFINMQGALVASSKADLFDGLLLTAAQWNEFGENYQAYAWTGASQTGGFGSHGHCNNWTSGSSGVLGTAGWVSAYTSAHFDAEDNQGCNNSYPIYCFGY